ncbi:OsmC family protein [Candidatus Magnetoovum chiemensis]|nr:OsmC family protein [Candidatus Magnetoovum chiemensis]
MEIKIVFPDSSNEVEADSSKSKEGSESETSKSKKVYAHLPDGKVIQTDQSVKSGGQGSAPEPYMYFLSSIGTCAGIYILSFCQKNEIPTKNITLTQKHEFISEAPGKSKLGRIIIEINVPKEFPEKYYDAIIRVAEGCAVKKTIMDPPEFEIKTVIQNKS